VLYLLNPIYDERIPGFVVADCSKIHAAVRKASSKVSNYGGGGSQFMKIRLFSGPGTRQWPRYSISDVPSIRGIRSAAGSGIDVVDISRGGTLLRTPRRLMPGTRIRLNVETSEGNMPVSGLVLRSSDANPEGGTQCQTAVVFNRPLKFPDGREQKVEAFRKVEYYPEADVSTIAGFLSIDFCNEQGAVTSETLRLNDW
jgi:hypothetical protein